MKKFIAGASILAYLSSYVYAFAQAPINIAPPAGAVNPSTTKIQLSDIPAFLIQAVFVIGIVISIFFLIWGGIKWVMSGGDKAGVESARNHIVAAIVGLIIIAGAYIIISILFQLIGAPNPITSGKFCIPTLTNPSCT